MFSENWVSGRERVCKIRVYILPRPDEPSEKDMLKNETTASIFQEIIPVEYRLRDSSKMHETSSNRSAPSSHSNCTFNNAFGI